MAPNPHPKTLFHLVPLNQVARQALDDKDNELFVSNSAGGLPGLEVGYHVPPTPLGRVITRLGRNTDLILRGNTVSRIHVAFELNPATNAVVLSVQSNRLAPSVTIAPVSEVTDTNRTGTPGQGSVEEAEVPESMPQDQVTGNSVIFYQQDYHLSIVAYKFRLSWVPRSANISQTLAIQGYQAALQPLQGGRARERPTEGDEEDALSWHITRFRTIKSSLFNDIQHLRKPIGHGAHGTVYEAVDQTSGHAFAIKVVNLTVYGDVERTRASLHREIKVMERLSHEHIIEFLGHRHFDTLCPEIFMPMREGSLTHLIKNGNIPNRDQLCLDVLKQTLSALDYLANENLVHRDVKPDNILYHVLPDKTLHFQLADFGLANHRSLATTICGTGYYQAPELYPNVSNVHAPQSPKMDVWSLFATVVAADCQFQGFPPDTGDYGVVLSILQGKRVSAFEPMARLDPNHRASAAQMLVLCFNSEGLTTRESKIPPLEPMHTTDTQSPYPLGTGDGGSKARPGHAWQEPKQPSTSPWPVTMNHEGGTVQQSRAHKGDVVRHIDDPRWSEAIVFAGTSWREH